MLCGAGPVELTVRGAWRAVDRVAIGSFQAAIGSGDDGRRQHAVELDPTVRDALDPGIEPEQEILGRKLAGNEKSRCRQQWRGSHRPTLAPCRVGWNSAGSRRK